MTLKTMFSKLKKIRYVIKVKLGSTFIYAWYFYAKRRYENFLAYTGISQNIQRELPSKYKIGLAVLSHERPEYLEYCLDSLFQTNIDNYDLTVLIMDDGSIDPRVSEIINRPYNPKFKIYRVFAKKGHNSWGAAFNRAMKALIEIDDFHVLGSCDSDALFHPDWLDKTMQIAIWAKKNHRTNVLGPFSSFNSSDEEFHGVLGKFTSPYGQYVVKQRMGALNYLYFKEDLIRLGFFEESKDDETLMTERFQKLRVRNFSTDVSYVEHIGEGSVLNQWRPVPVMKSVYGLNLCKQGWPKSLEKLATFGYLRYLKPIKTIGAGLSSALPLEVYITATSKDAAILPTVIEGVRRNLKHPIRDIFIVTPKDKKLIELTSVLPTIV